MSGKNVPFRHDVLSTGLHYDRYDRNSTNVTADSWIQNCYSCFIVCSFLHNGMLVVVSKWRQCLCPWFLCATKTLRNCFPNWSMSKKFFCLQQQPPKCILQLSPRKNVLSIISHQDYCTLNRLSFLLSYVMESTFVVGTGIYCREFSEFYVKSYYCGNCSWHRSQTSHRGVSCQLPNHTAKLISSCQN